MTILYERLGLKPGATYAAIRAAYRQLAKEAHPDAGGDPEQFAELQEAHDVLTDPDRRKVYDSTGQITGERVDLTDQAAMQVINGGLTQMLVDDRERSTALIIEELRRAVQAAADEIGGRLRQLERAGARAARWAESAKRTKGDGENRLKGMLLWHVRQSSEMAEKVRRDYDAHKRALQILDEHGFSLPTMLRASELQAASSTSANIFFGGPFGM